MSIYRSIVCLPQKYKKNPIQFLKRCSVERLPNQKYYIEAVSYDKFEICPTATQECLQYYQQQPSLDQRMLYVSHSRGNVYFSKWSAAGSASDWYLQCGNFYLNCPIKSIRDTMEHACQEFFYRYFHFSSCCWQ